MTSTRTYRSIGNDKPWKPAAYQHTSRFDVPIQQERKPFDWFQVVLWSGMIGATLGVAAFALGVFTAASDAPASAHNASQVEARADGKVGL